LRLTIATDSFLGRGELQKIRPLESVSLTFRDRNVQDNVFSDGSFLLGNVDEWNIKNDIYSLTAQAHLDDYELSAIVDTLEAGTPTDDPAFYSDGQTLTFSSTGDRVRVTFKIRCEELIMDSGFAGDPSQEVINIIPQLRKGTATGTILTSTSGYGPVLSDLNSEYATYTMMYNLTASDTYFLEFVFDTQANAWTDYDYVDIRIDDVYMTVEYALGSDVTFDSFSKYSNKDSVFKDDLEVEVFFGDSAQDSDSGSIQQGGTRSQRWARYGKTETLHLHTCFAMNLLANFARHKDYLRISMIDALHTVKPYTLITVDSRDYQIVNIDEVYAGNARRQLDLEVIEVLNTDVDYGILSQSLNTIDGKSSTSSSISSGGGSSTWSEITSIPAWLDATTVEDFQADHSHTLQQITDTGNTTDVGIVFDNGVDEVDVFCDEAGNLRVTGNLVVEGDVVAYAGGGDPATSIWDDLADHVDGTTIDYVDGELAFIGETGGEYFTGILSDPPAAADIVEIMGNANLYPSGYKATINDEIEGIVIQVTAIGSAWHYTILTLAV
jgi:hypothetical protein